jgi:quercetin dioxygenase-like cupin family protein
MNKVRGRATQRLFERQGVMGMECEVRSQFGTDSHVGNLAFIVAARPWRGYRTGMSTRRLGLMIGLVLVVSSAAGCGESSSTDEVPAVLESAAVTSPPEAEERVLDKQELTALDQRITYPNKKPARISSETIVLEPGEQTGWRRHRIPVYVQVLSGVYTVDYGEGALVEYPAGSAFVQAIKTDYNGTNATQEPVSVLHVYLGAKGIRDVIER